MAQFTVNLTLRTTCAPTATTGVLITSALTLYSVELPWRDNEPDKSCVPLGEYQLIPYVSATHGATWRLHNPALFVWGRSGIAPDGMRTQIELHSANWCRQLLGCIAFGLEGQPMLDPATGKVEPAVEHSVDAINELRTLLDGLSEEYLLTIIRDGLYAPSR